jgi:hypothetical protein
MDVKVNKTWEKSQGTQVVTVGYGLDTSANSRDFTLRDFKRAIRQNTIR